MGRKAQITKEMILDAAYELLDEGGIGAVGIKSIANKLGCSTQPVSWLFGSMTDLKKELYFYSGSRLYAPMTEALKGKEALEAFFISGKIYLSNACDHPHVFRFLNVDDPMDTIGDDVAEGRSIFEFQFDEDVFKLLSKEYDVSPKLLGEAVRDTVIYTHGLALMMIFDNYRMPKSKAIKMMYNMGVTLLSNIGIKADKKFC
jgi:AcrR family transcriptional regulator